MKNADELIHSFPATDIVQGNYEGLTKREYFAGLAMQGLIANAPNGHLNNSYEGCSLAAQWADQLLEELEKTQP